MNTSALVVDGPGLALLVHPGDGPPVQVHTGAANLELGVPVGDTTTFNVGSVAKQITAHLVLLAARQGLLSLDRPVTALLPRFRIPDVTVADLLLHHGGVRDAESLLSLAGLRDLDHYTADDLLALSYRQTSRAAPPGRFLYSNTGYLLIAEILRTVHGTDLLDLAHQQLFAPLGMASTCFKADPRQAVPGSASAYQVTRAGWEHCARPVALPGPGSLWCTAADLDRWLAHLHSTWLQHPDVRLPAEADLPYRVSDHPPHLYGPGLYADARPEHAAVFHYGHEQGFSAAVHLAREGLRVICLSNHAALPADHVVAALLDVIRGNPDGDLPAAVSQAALRPLNQRPFAPSRLHSADAVGQTDTSHTVLGTYTCDQVPGALRLSYSDGALHLWRRGTCDRLVQAGPAAFRGRGYTLVLPAAGDRPVGYECFTLNLDRAPGLQYLSTSGGSQCARNP
ncbi:serine hydrolase domain-containing protein [Streptomyces sp. NPDC001380]|uniref:serine hydrolase domain-containing protein n=1 Tax=Streptomyces sp. NPDC001380 TaxID=3364566 RepID=UPI0036CE8148